MRRVGKILKLSKQSSRQNRKLTMNKKTYSTFLNISYFVTDLHPAVKTYLITQRL